MTGKLLIEQFMNSILPLGHAIHYPAGTNPSRFSPCRRPLRQRLGWLWISAPKTQFKRRSAAFSHKSFKKPSILGYNQLLNTCLIQLFKL